MHQSPPLYPWGTAPCDDCVLALQCKARLEACGAFAVYLNGGGEKRWRGLPREPHHDLYIRLLGRRPPGRQRTDPRPLSA